MGRKGSSEISPSVLVVRQSFPKAARMEWRDYAVEENKDEKNQDYFKSKRNMKPISPGCTWICV